MCIVFFSSNTSQHNSLCSLSFILSHSQCSFRISLRFGYLRVEFVSLMPCDEEKKLKNSFKCIETQFTGAERETKMEKN